MKVTSRAILLRNFRVDCAIGIHDFEQDRRQTVVINVDVELVHGRTVFSDRIEDTLDYDFLRLRILDLVRDRKFDLQETLCEEIAAICLEKPEVSSVKVQTFKPDVYPDCDAVGYELVASRS